MKKQLITAVLIVNTLTYAGGNIEPIEVQTEENKEIGTVSNTNLYTGLGISNLKLKNDFSKESFKAKALTLQLGYKLTDYLAIEGRYTRHIGDVKYDHGSDHRVNEAVDIKDYPTDFSNTAIYLKPSYSYDNFTAYALLGYGEVLLTDLRQDGKDRAEDGFQWGLGLAYEVNDKVALFVDYIILYDDKGFNYIASNRNIKADALTLGLSYRF